MDNNFENFWFSKRDVKRVPDIGPAEVPISRENEYEYWSMLLSLASDYQGHADELLSHTENQGAMKQGRKLERQAHAAVWLSDEVMKICQQPPLPSIPGITDPSSANRPQIL